MRIVHYLFLNTLVFLFLGNTSTYGAFTPLPQNAVITDMEAFDPSAIEYALFMLQEARESGSGGNKVVDSSNGKMLEFFIELNKQKMAIEKGSTYQHIFTPSEVDHIKWNLATDLLLFRALLQYIPTQSTGLFAGWRKSKRREVTGAHKQDLLTEIDILLNAFEQDPAFQKYKKDITQLIKDFSVQAPATLLQAYQNQHASIVSQYDTYKISTTPPDAAPDVVHEPIDPVIASKMVHELAGSLALLHSYMII